jgi:tetratricopeptide (TPR) repeat protein
MTPIIRPATIGICLALAAGTLATSQTAFGADDDRRQLSARDMESVDDPSSEYAKMAEEKRLQSIDFLKDLLSQGDAEGQRKAEMMLRLADLYFQQGRSIFLREMDGFDKKYDRCTKDETCDDQALFNEGPDNHVSSDWQEKSIRLYEQILRNYPRYRRADEATFYLAMALQDTNRRKEAVDNFRKLTKTYPESDYVPDAYVNIGEYHFDTNNAYKALLAYKRATAFRDSPKYSFALYKLAWCYYNVGEYGKSIDTMKSVVAYTQTQRGQSSAIQLQDEALKDLVRFFADAGEMNEAYEYFTKLGKKDLIRSMLMRLAKMYFDQGKFEQTIQTYRRLINENPQSPDNPDYQVEIIKAYKKIGKKPETLQEIDRLLKTYGKQSAWARSNASNQDAVKAASESIEKNLRRVAVEYHTEAKKLGNNQGAQLTYELAYKAYSVYLKEFPDSSHLYEVRYAFAELLYKVKKYDEAYDQYMAVVKLDPKGKHSRFCAESAIFASEEMVKKEGGKAITKGTQKISKDVQPIELTAWEQKLIDACAQYATLYPKDKKVRNVIYKSAYMLYQKYRFAEAADQFNLVIKMEPASQEAEQAANLILDSFTVREDYSNLKKNSKFYYDQEGLGSAKFKKQVYNIYQRASFFVIVEDFKKNSDKNKTAGAYMSFYEEFKTTAELEVLSKALNNAAVYYRDEKKVSDSMRVRHILVEDPQFGDKTKYYYTQIAALGYDYEMIADFSKAADYYEKMFALYPSEKKKVAAKDKEAAAGMVDMALDAIYTSAVFRRAGGQIDEAVADYRKFLKQANLEKKDDSRINDVKLTIARTYEEQEDWANAAKEYTGFYTQAGNDVAPEFTYFARLHHGRALKAQGKSADDVYRRAIADYNKYIKAGGKIGEQTEYVAEMMHDQALPAVESYVQLKIESKGKGVGRRTEDRHMKAQLVSKQKKLQELDATLKAIIATKSGPWSLAALVQLGKVQENMSDALLKGDTPYYLTEDQAEIYGMGMQDMAYPRVQAAVTLYRLALDKAYELTLYNDDTAYATRRLGELAPEDFPGLEEEVLAPNFTSSKSRTYDFEPEL